MQTNLPGPLSLVGGVIFPSRLKYLETLEEAGMPPSTMLFLLSGRSLKDSLFIILSLNSHISFHTQANRTEYYLSGEAMAILNTGLLEVFFYFKKTQQEIHRLWIPGYFQGV